MFDMIKVAQKIRTARITNNMTQMQLAEEIGVSYQAVSSWERGNSMPDISKLEQLCNILNLTVDELLGTTVSGQAVKKIIAAEAKPDSSPAELTMEELQETAPLLPPNDINDYAEKTFEHSQVKNIAEIVGLAPFLSQNTLDNLVKNLPTPDVNYIAALAPFVSTSVLDAWAQNLATDDQHFIAGLAPFLSRSAVDRLAKNICTPSGRFISSIAPFVSSSVLDALTQDFETDDPHYISSLAPFLSRNTLDNLVKNVHTPNSRFLSSVAPFVSSSVLDSLALNLERVDLHEVSHLAPFLSQKTLDLLLLKSMTNPNNEN